MLTNPCCADIGSSNFWEGQDLCRGLKPFSLILTSLKTGLPVPEVWNTGHSILKIGILHLEDIVVSSSSEEMLPWSSGLVIRHAFVLVCSVAVWLKDPVMDSTIDILLSLIEGKLSLCFIIILGSSTLILPAIAACTDHTAVAVSANLWFKSLLKEVNQSGLTFNSCP
jgi:hypothetical protein